jgi:hypothetical protein
MTLVELKAKAYDILAQIEFLQRALTETNVEIEKAIKEAQQPVEAEEVL